MLLMLCDFYVSSKWKCDERMLNVGMGNPLIKIYRVDGLINVPSYLRPRLWTGRWPWLPRPGCWPTGTCWWPSSNPHLGITQVLSIVSAISVDVEPIDYFWMQARAPTECWAKMPFDPSCCFHFHCQKCKVLHYILCSLLLTRSENWVTLSEIKNYISTFRYQYRNICYINLNFNPSEITTQIQIRVNKKGYDLRMWFKNE